MSDEPISLVEHKRRLKAEETPDPRPPEFSDITISHVFADRHANDMRYVAAWAKWFIYSGVKWEADDMQAAFDASRAVCEEQSLKATLPRIATAVSSAKTVAAVERLAKANGKIAANVAQWDADPWLLNTPGGVLDLRAGKTRAHVAADYMTKSAAVEPGGEWETWRRFLDRVTDGDEDLQQFLQRMAGYALTGDTSEHALFFLFGTGANGKSVFLDALAGILGDYSRTAPMETFTASNSDRHPTDLAMLRGARMVTSIETDEGRRWAEARIKTLTGGDPIAARFMRQDFFEYTPQFKLVIAGNHKPSLRSVDEAIRRRFHLVPFTVTIPQEERDPHLKSKLRQEWSGILSWMVEGCLEWQRVGLAPPQTVIEATVAYLEAEDATAAWLEECCDLDPQVYENSSTLWDSWKSWAEKNGEPAETNKKLSKLLENRGFHKKGTNSGKRFLGLRVKPPVTWGGEE